MKRNKKMVTLLKAVLIIAISWFILTLFVESAGSEETVTIGKSTAAKKALIVYDPDPIYNLDEQVCKRFSEGLSPKGWFVKITSVATAHKLKEEFDLYVFCTNTYNFAPDWTLRNYIKKQGNLENKAVVAITLGAGSTDRAQSILEEEIKEKEANLIASKAFWLMRPNVQSRTKESNIDVAVEMAHFFGMEVAQQMDNISKLEVN